MFVIWFFLFLFPRLFLGSFPLLDRSASVVTDPPPFPLVLVAFHPPPTLAPVRVRGADRYLAVTARGLAGGTGTGAGAGTQDDADGFRRAAAGTNGVWCAADGRNAAADGAWRVLPGTAADATADATATGLRRTNECAAVWRRAWRVGRLRQ